MRRTTFAELLQLSEHPLAESFSVLRDHRARRGRESIAFRRLPDHAAGVA